jgi:hypothetical protein
VIIVEGPDAGGKSTLCKRLCKEFSLELSTHSRLPKHIRDDPSYRSREGVRKRTYTALLLEVTARQAPEVHDRFFYSEMIYSHIFERKCAFNYAEEVMISKLIRSFGAPVIFCLPPWEEVSKRFLTTQQNMEGLPGKIDLIYKQYEQQAGFMQNANITSVRRNKQMKAKRMPSYEFIQPKVYVYDYTDSRSWNHLVGRVTNYLVQRKKRQDSWSG